MRRFLSKRCRKVPPTELVTVRRTSDGPKVASQCAAAKGRQGSLTKCGSTESMTVRRVYDGPSCRFIMQFREVIPVPIFQEFKCFGRRPSTDRCVYEDPSYLTLRVMKRAAEEIAHVWDDGVHDGPSRGSSTQPHFHRFPANRILV